MPENLSKILGELRIRKSLESLGPYKHEKKNCFSTDSFSPSRTVQLPLYKNGEFYEVTSSLVILKDEIYKNLNLLERLYLYSYKAKDLSLYLKCF